MNRLWKAIFWFFLCVCHRIGLRAGQKSDPIIVISLPRSGSSWIGACLGISSSALYYREPFTRPYSAANGGRVVFDVDPECIPKEYQASSKKIERLSPHIRPSVVAYPHQWPPFSHHARVPVIKEVNPLACRWLIDRFRPRAVVVLVRHPAGIARSMRALGWLLGDESSLDDWRRFGARVSNELQQMLAQLSEFEQVKIVRYEDVCAAPKETLKSMYEDLGLKWTTQSEQWVQGSSKAQVESKDHFSVRRDSTKNAYRWRESISAEQLAALMEGYRENELPEWYDEQGATDNGVIKDEKMVLGVRRKTA